MIMQLLVCCVMLMATDRSEYVRHAAEAQGKLGANDNATIGVLRDAYGD